MSDEQKNSGSKTDIPSTSSSTVGEEGPEAILENLYKKNIEISNKNKTLSLLSKLYEISILTLEPEDLAKRVAQSVQADLSFEVVGIYTFDTKGDVLAPLAFSESERFKTTLEGLEISLGAIVIPNVSTNDFFKKSVGLHQENVTNNIQEVWKSLIDPAKLKLIGAESYIKSTVLSPLLVENRVLGAIMIVLNRNYETLNTFEKESINSFVNSIALALEKAYLYKELENANTRLKELDRQKDELLSIVSHQLATPITSLRWYIEMMLDGDVGKLEAGQEEHVKSMQSIANNLSDLVGLILDVSRIDLGRMKMVKDEINLSTLFKEILEVIEPKAKEKNITFIKKIQENLPTAMLDKRHTRMTLENLLSNAVKYTNQGEVDISASVDNNILSVIIRDTGCGIPQADQSRVFEKLFRASNVRNSIEGNGFGLYIAKGAIEQQGGTIRFESTEGKGTTFFITLPLSTK